MRKQLHRLMNSFLLIALFSLLVITSCNQAGSRKIDVSTEQMSTSSECRTVQHKLGEVCIPIQPQRIVALDPRYILDPLLALGIKPVGFAAYSERGRTYLTGLSPNEVAAVGWVEATKPNIPKYLNG